MVHSLSAPRPQVRTIPPSQAVTGCHDCATPRSEVACHRSEPDLHVVEATGNTVRCGLPFGRISTEFSSDNDATGDGNDHPKSSEIKEVPQDILREVVSLGMTRSFCPAGHLDEEDFAPSCGGSPKDMHLSSAPGHLKESAGQAVGQPTDSTMCYSGGEAITRSREVTREDTKSNSCMEESPQDVGRTPSFPLTRRLARTPCYPSKGPPGAHVSKVIVASHAKGPRPCTSKTAEAGVMVQRNDHHQKSPIYRVSYLPKIGENVVDSGRISTQGASEKAHCSNSISVGGMPRGGAESVRGPAN